ncbi:GumC family protein [Tropicimonas marinistellae]|uniref:GumC family protein n=1 Tax=Tropicimonas marinistellae TaxID=1739787 RepID=UPI00083074E3|nr:polysaccharide biosynthesis tyrosine autokinase [Tropicimonas marinistellae]
MNQLNRLIADGPVKRIMTPGEDSEVDYFSNVLALWRGRLLIMAITLLGLIVGFVNAEILATPIYKATSTIKLEGEETTVAGLPSLTAGTDLWNQANLITEIGVIESYNLAEKLVLELDLLNDPDFNPYIESGTEGAVGDNRAGGTSDGSGEPRPSDEKLLYEIASDVRDSISVINPDWSNLLDISVTDTDAERAALMSNTLADLYIRDQIEVRFERTREAKNWLSDETTALKSDLEAASRRIEEFRAKADLQNEETLSALNFQLKTLRERVESAEREMRDLEAKKEQMVAAQASGSLSQQATAYSAATGRSLRGSVDESSEEAVAAFSDTFEKALQTVDVRLNRQRDQVASLQTSLDRQQETIDRQSREYVELRQLEREAEADRLIYEYFLARLKEASVKEGFAQASARILTPAFEGIQIAPNSPKVVVTMGFFAFLVGCGIVLLRDRINDTYRLGETLENDTGLPVLGQIPQIPGKSRIDLISYVVGKPGSAPAEAVRGLRTSLQFSSIDSPPRVIIVTSSVPGEGKTVTSVALAHHFAGLGKAVLLVEGDVRRRAFAEIFPEPPEHSLLSVMSGEAGLLEAVQSHTTLGIDILLSAETSANPVDILSSQAFGCLMDVAREAYDVILIDTPPLLLVPDARVVGQYADSILFAVQWDSTRRVQVRDALAQLRLAGLSPDGLVLTNIDTKRMQAYGHGQRYGAYAAKGASKYYTT